MKGRFNLSNQRGALKESAAVDLARALATPSGYAKHRLGMALHPKQAAVLDDLFSKPKNRVFFRCGNEVGKTSRVGTAAILYALEILHARVQSTAGANRQVTEQLIPNLKRYSHLFKSKGWEFLDKTIKIKGVNQYLGYAARDEGTFQGFHEESESEQKIPQFIMIDEGAAVRDEIYGAAEERCNPTYLLVMGSPLGPSGMFYRMSRELSRFYSQHRLQKVDCLKSKGFWIEDADVERIIAKYGEKHPLVLSSVYADFSETVEFALIGLTELENCIENPPPVRRGDRHAFCDFAAGRDKNVLAVRQGNRVWIERKWTEVNTMAAVGEFIGMFAKLKRDIGLQADEIEGDADGLGKPMVDRIREVGHEIGMFHGGGAPRMDQRYADAWTEAWSEGCAKIKRGEIILPNDEDLRAQILGRKTKRNSNGKLKLESKEEMRKRGLPSPDEADAVLMAMTPAPVVKSFQSAGPVVEPSWGQEQEQAYELAGIGGGIW